MPSPQLPLARLIVAVVVVILTVVAAWKFVDYRNRPPPVKEVIAGQ